MKYHRSVHNSYIDNHQEIHGTERPPPGLPCMNRLPKELKLRKHSVSAYLRIKTSTYYRLENFIVPKAFFSEELTQSSFEILLKLQTEYFDFDEVVLGFTMTIDLCKFQRIFFYNFF